MRALRPEDTTMGSVTQTSSYPPDGVFLTVLPSPWSPLICMCVCEHTTIWLPGYFHSPPRRWAPWGQVCAGCTFCLGHPWHILGTVANTEPSLWWVFMNYYFLARCNPWLRCEGNTCVLFLVIWLSQYTEGWDFPWWVTWVMLFPPPFGLETSLTSHVSRLGGEG